jgi:hypothetical protein
MVIGDGCDDRILRRARVPLIKTNNKGRDHKDTTWRKVDVLSSTIF